MNSRAADTPARALRRRRLSWPFPAARNTARPNSWGPAVATTQSMVVSAPRANPSAIEISIVQRHFFRHIFRNSGRPKVARPERGYG